MGGSVSEPTPAKPYLLRALYEWCVDNGYTPYLSVVVDANTRVPMEYVREGRIVLNIGPLATNRLQMGNEVIEFSALFSGASRELSIPVTAVTAIYARENGQGMSFDIEHSKSAPEESTFSQDAGELPDAPKPAGGRPALRRVK
jgi:stringent starvation protein B